MAGQTLVSDLKMTAGPTAAAQDDGLSALVREHGRLVFRIAYSLLRDHHDAEDAVQEVFLRVLKQSKKLEELQSPKAWLAQIAWRVASDKAKSRPAAGKMEPIEDSSAEDLVALKAGGASPDELAAKSEMQRMLESLIGSLPKELREPLLLTAQQELSSAEVAEVLGVPEGTVRTRVMRARQLLKEKLTARLGGTHA